MIDTTTLMYAGCIFITGVVVGSFIMSPVPTSGREPPGPEPTIPRGIPSEGDKSQSTDATAPSVCHEICADPDLIMCVDNGGGKDDDATSAAQEREWQRIRECPLRGKVQCSYDTAAEDALMKRKGV